MILNAFLPAVVVVASVGGAAWAGPKYEISRIEARLYFEGSGEIGTTDLLDDKPHAMWNTIITLKESYRVAIAKRVDDRVLSREDGDLQMAQINSQISGEQQRREIARRAVGAQEAAASAAQSQAFSNLLARIAPPPSPLITCTQFGNTTTCQ